MYVCVLLNTTLLSNKTIGLNSDLNSRTTCMNIMVLSLTIPGYRRENAGRKTATDCKEKI